MRYAVVCFLFSSCFAFAQAPRETKNVIVITLDGFRWQEIFRGANEKLLHNDQYSPDSIARHRFSGVDAVDRRSKLLPFFWNTVATSGQLYGNRDAGNYMSCANPYWFSYPGYHEMLVGAVNRKVCSNLKVPNPDATVLEFLNRQDVFNNRVAAFATWEVFPFILNEKSTGISVNAGIEQVMPTNRALSPAELAMNDRQSAMNERTDSITFHLAFEHLKHDRPKILFIGLDGPDHYAHSDRYDAYLTSAHEADQWISMLWSWVQSDPEYRDHTTIVLTTDHGRGQNSTKSWRHHGRLTRGSRSGLAGGTRPGHTTHGNRNDEATPVSKTDRSDDCRTYWV